MGSIRSTEDNDPKIYGEVCFLKKERRKRQKLLVIELLYEYAKNSTLHGLRYIVDRGLYAFEKMFWLLTFLLSVGMCTYLIYNVYMKWKTSPVIVSFSERVVPVGDVPFPSVTICPQMKVKASVYNYSGEFERYTKSILQLYNSTNETADNINETKYLNKLQHIDTVCNLDYLHDPIDIDERNCTNGSLVSDLYEVRVKSTNPHWASVVDYGLTALILGRIEPLGGDVYELVMMNQFLSMFFPVYLSPYQNSSISVQRLKLIEVAPSLDDVFQWCEWRGESFECSEFITSVITSEGICYTFNTLAASEVMREKNVQQRYKYSNAEIESKDWSLTKGYSKDFAVDRTYPKRGQENNASPDLRVILKESPADHDNFCNVVRSGYTIYVQHPTDLPQASLYYYAALPGQVSSLALKFTLVITDDSLKGYTPNVRQCYFPEDRKLKYFRIYSPSNCRLECQSNYTYNRCGCVWFHMPHHAEKICIGSDGTQCVREALEELSMAELNIDENLRRTQPCNCLPSCNSVQYDAEILKTNFNAKSYLETQEKLTHENLSSFILMNMSQIEVYFKEPRFISMRRSELFGLTDFMANCGGLLGLFLGFSFLSLVEIFYFGTIRLFTILRRDLKEEKTNKAKEKDENHKN